MDRIMMLNIAIAVVVTIFISCMVCTCERKIFKGIWFVVLIMWLADVISRI